MIKLEKKNGRRIEVLRLEGDKTVYQYLGEETEKSLKTLMFDKLFRDLKDDETPEQLTDEQLQQYKQALEEEKNVVKAEKKAERISTTTKVEAAEAERKALFDESINIKAVDGFSHRGNATVNVVIEDFEFINEITFSGHVQYTWLKKAGILMPEYENKGVKTIAPMIAAAIGKDTAVVEAMMKQTRLDGIANSSITVAAVRSKKAELAAEKAKLREAGVTATGETVTLKNAEALKARLLKNIDKAKEAIENAEKKVVEKKQVLEALELKLKECETLIETIPAEQLAENAVTSSNIEE